MMDDVTQILVQVLSLEFLRFFGWNIFWFFTKFSLLITFQHMRFFSYQFQVEICHFLLTLNWRRHKRKLKIEFWAFFFSSAKKIFFAFKSVSNSSINFFAFHLTWGQIGNHFQYHLTSGSAVLSLFAQFFPNIFSSINCRRTNKL